MKDYLTTFKIDFSKLIGNKYSLETKMNVLDWMLKTGRGIEYRYGWNVEGINKALFAYSANNHNHISSLPSINELDLYFDAIFGRAIFATANNSLKEWRKKESIFPRKYRMLKFNDGIQKYKELGITHLISDIQNFKGKLLKKELHHPDYKERTKPKILNISIYTIGNGWVVKYLFSFKEFNYEPGWTKKFYQNKDESVLQFIERSYDELCCCSQRTNILKRNGR